MCGGGSIFLCQDVGRVSWALSAVLSPVQGWVFLQDVHVDVLLDQTVQQDRQRGEADIVESQICCIVERLRETEREGDSKTDRETDTEDR